MANMIFAKNDYEILKALSNRKIIQQEIELEAVIKREISAESFKKLAKALSQNQYTREENPEVLDIFTFTSSKKDSSIRFSVNGLDNIRNYCKEDNSDNFNKIYKTNVAWKVNEIQQLEKKLPPNYYRNELMMLELYDHDHLRFNSKLEIPFDEKSGMFLNHDAEQKYVDLKQFIQNVGWQNIKKTFRYKKRTSFISSDKNFRIDLTIVKSSKRLVNLSGREELFPTKSFRESNCINEKEVFEVEIEYIGNLKDADLICQGFNNHCNFVISKLFFRTDNVITNTERNDIIGEYTDTILRMLENGAVKSINELRDIIHEASKPDFTEDKLNKYSYNYSLFKDHKERVLSLITTHKSGSKENTLLSHLEMIRNNITRRTGNYEYTENDKNKFFYIPNVISMSIENIQESFPRNIINGFTVTDKADGETMVLFVSERYKSIYMIDNNLQVNKINGNITSELNNAIIAGEYVSRNKFNEEVSLFLAFDAYYLNNQDLRFLPLINDTSECRVSKIHDVFKNITIDSGFNIEVKSFLYGANIFTLSKSIWDKNEAGLFSYKLDGLIYTPQLEPVAYDNSKIDYFTQMRTTWFRNLKWKPADENTIDFLVKIEKERIVMNKEKNTYIERDKIKYMSVIDGNKSEFKAYKTIELWCGFRSSITRNPCGEHTSSQTNYIEKYIDTRFTPTHPYNELAYIANIECDSNNNIFGLDDNTKILDNTIVEFRYNIHKKADTHEEGFFRWEPLKTRNDKTSEYHNALKNKERVYRIFRKYIDSQQPVTYKNWSMNEMNELRELEVIIRKYKLYKIGFLPGSHQDYSWIYKSLKNERNRDIILSINNPMDIPLPIKFGNDFKTANDIWSSTYNPITIDMITNGTNIPTLADRESLYYTREVSRDKSSTLNTQIFHNKVIKNIELLSEACKMLDNGQHNLTLLDFATGRGGDLYKWKDNKVRKVVGIDLVDSNIYDTKDGACIRYTEFKKNMEAFNVDFIPDVSFLHGDISKNILDGSALIREHSKDLHRSLWFENENTQYSVNKFDIISMQFAIHYLFKDESMFNNLLNNIKENLKPNGLFIGCCFDGNLVYNALLHKQLGESLDGYKDDQLIWRIRKQYLNLSEPKKHDAYSPMGMAIDVYLHSIGKSITEYLVNYDYLVRRLAEINLVPVKTETFGDIYKKYSGSPDFKHILSSMDSSEKQFSFLNRLFIFKKESNDVILVDEIYSNILQNRSSDKYVKALKEVYTNSKGDLLSLLLTKLYGSKITEQVIAILIQKLKENPIKSEKSTRKTATLQSYIEKEESVSEPSSVKEEKKTLQSLVAESNVAEKATKMLVPELPNPEELEKQRTKFLEQYSKFAAIIPRLPGNFTEDQIAKSLKGLKAIQKLYKEAFNLPAEYKAVIDAIGRIDKK